MRYVVLVMLGSFGVALLFIAWYRFKAVNVELAGMNTVEGTVDSIGPDGDLNVKYRVGADAYEIVRSVPVKIPFIRAGDTVPLVYDSARPDTAKVRQWSVIYPDSAVAGGFGVVGILFAIGAFVMMGSIPSRSLREALQDPQAQPYVQQPPASTRPAPVTLDGPIELHNTRSEFYFSFVLAAVGFAAGFFLYRNPWFLWTRWLAYPAAALLVLFGIGMIFAAFDTQTMRIRANQDGVEIEDSLGSRKFLWTDVAALKRETVARSTWQSGRTFARGYVSKVMGRYLILLDSSGKELLKLDEDVAMEPVQDWQRLRAYIPARTGLPVKEETRETLL